MLLLHQTGSVHVGEVVRYTLTYTPSVDRILPAPQCLYVKVKNTSAIPLRAAYLHGPYTLSTACYPSTFDPNKKHEDHEKHGAPDFEPNLKAGGHWRSRLLVPPEVQQTAGSSSQNSDTKDKSFSWVIEVTSQVIFSNSAAVHFEVLVGRDERSVELGFNPTTTSTSQGAAGKVADHISNRATAPTQAKGIFSKAVQLVVEDTTTLWNSPAFPRWKEDDNHVSGGAQGQQKGRVPTARKKQKIHLVIVTHGLHSNVGADMLYLKESIDATARQAREDAKIRKAKMRAEELEREREREQDTKPAGASKSMSTPEVPVTPTPESPQQKIAGDDGDGGDGDDDDEQVIVRGFGGNTIRTEKGIQYLGKRLAKYVLSMTYPNQPHLPVKSSISRSIARSLQSPKSLPGEGEAAHKGSSIHKADQDLHHELAYQITSISFIGHSLGGLTQTYAIAYIKKHSPDFFDLIKPINFVALASPFLGLSNENPVYVKFALDFGLVGRTGQDLGLTWRPPTVVRSGWGAMIGGLGNEEQKVKSVNDPGAKPLLRILPIGPAHAALKLFRNRSIYSNVVNDGIVPLRTSCLLFLDWRGLERVEKARREDGLVGTMVGWGWAEMMGLNASSLKSGRPWADFFSDSGEETDTKKKKGQHADHRDEVPQPRDNATVEDDLSGATEAMEPQSHQFLGEQPGVDGADDEHKAKQDASQQPSSGWAGLLSFFKPQASTKPLNQTPSKQTKIYHRGQTTNLAAQDPDSSSPADSETTSASERRPLVRGPSLYTKDAGDGDVKAPPRTTFFESAGDVLKPPLPSKEFLVDPAARPRTIFHDRIYHPEDILPPAVKETRSFMQRATNRERKVSSDSASEAGSTSKISSAPPPPPPIEHEDLSDMKIEEKIARAYHRDLSWRKVLVRLEPDAHNNMIVRRMFANAYGWPVIKHLCDTHFGFTAAAILDDATESGAERVQATGKHVHPAGEHVEGQEDPPPVDDGDDEHSDEQPQPNSRPLPRSLKDSERGANRIAHRSIRLPKRTDSEIHEATDEVADLSVAPSTTENSMSSSLAKVNTANSPDDPVRLSRHSRTDSARWSDRFFDGSEDDESDLDFLNPPSPPPPPQPASSSSINAATESPMQWSSGAGLGIDSGKAPETPRGTSEADIDRFLSTPPSSDVVQGRKQQQQQQQHQDGGRETRPTSSPKPLLAKEFTSPPRPLRDGDGDRYGVGGG